MADGCSWQCVWMLALVVTGGWGLARLTNMEPKCKGERSTEERQDMKDRYPAATRYHATQVPLLYARGFSHRPPIHCIEWEEEKSKIKTSHPLTARNAASHHTVPCRLS